MFAYLLRDLAIKTSNHVWAADISYIPMSQGFLYLFAIIDWSSRRILSWRLSNTMTTDFCSKAVDEAIAHYGAPKIFNTDQGSQFTDRSFVDVICGHGVALSMDGKGCWRDNVFIERFSRSLKYEEVYLHAYDGAKQARTGIGKYIITSRRRFPTE